MRRTLSCALLTLAAVPALLAVPVLGRTSAPAHPVPPRLVSLPLTGVDVAALAALPRVAGQGVGPGAGARAGAGAAPGAVTGPGAGAVTVAALPVPAVLTKPLTTARFDLVAVSWNHAAAAGARVSVRVREGGTWTGWQPLAQDDDGPDAGSVDAARAAATGARDATSPLLTGGADGVQVQVVAPGGRAPAGLRLDLVDGGRSAADAPSSGPADAAQAATGQPAVVTRAQWGADESLVREAGVLNTSVKALLLHHTETTNSYSSAQAYAQVRSVYAFHTQVRGWNDVGYNFLVDRYGRVYEGRRGSLAGPVQGAHAGGFNSETLGIAVLGSFSTESVPAAAESAAVPLLAWQASLYDINPRGRAVLISGGGSYTRYKAGTPVAIPGVAGHRDVDSTECPGNAFYPDLGSIRTRVAALMVPDLIDPALTGTVTSTGGDPIVFSAAVPTRQRWWMTVTALCAGPAVRTISGTTTSRIAASWDLRATGGAAVPAGAYTVSVTSSSPVGVIPVWSRDVEVLASAPSLAPVGVPGPSSTAVPVGLPVPVSTGAPLTAAGPVGNVVPIGAVTPTDGVGCPVQRVAAADPALTSVLAGRVSHAQARTVVLVNAGTGEGLAQALAAAPLAAARNAPLLLTDATSLPAVVATDIAARRVDTAVLVGSTAVITPAVEAQLRALGVATVARLAGTDRWSTAAVVAAAVDAAVTAAGRAPSHQAVLASGDQGELLDTLVAAGSAAAAGRPVLLTGRAGVPAATLAALKALKVTSVTVVGSKAAVPEASLPALAKAGVIRRSRVIGVDRWTTAVAVSTAFAGLVPTDRVVLASGLEAGADLLIASGQARTILLTDRDTLPGPTANWLFAHRPAVSLIARPDAVSTPVLRAALTARAT